MIGNDIVDLALTRKENNWKRNGFLDKIFTVKEQILITNSENPEFTVWNLWSRKEATYKIINRQTKKEYLSLYNWSALILKLMKMKFWEELFIKVIIILHKQL